MKTFVISILSIFLFTMIGVWATTPEAEGEGQLPRKVLAELSQDTTWELYEFACEFVQGQFPEVRDKECPNPPVTLLTPMKSSTYGYYIPGSSIVWLNSNFTSQPDLSTYGEGITIHEAVHYIFYEWDLMQDDKEYCREENLAWTASDLWVAGRSRPEDVSEEWWEWYPHCDGPFANPNSEITIAIRKIFT